MTPTQFEQHCAKAVAAARAEIAETFRAANGEVALSMARAWAQGVVSGLTLAGILDADGVMEMRAGIRALHETEAMMQLGRRREAAGMAV